MGRTFLCLFAGAFLCSPANAHDAKRGTAEGSIGGRKVTIEYGRPELKGRSLDALLAQLPEDRVWRAGTDEATTLTTEGALALESMSGAACTRLRAPVEGRKVPAGRYTLYVSAPPSGAVSLIL